MRVAPRAQLVKQSLDAATTALRYWRTLKFTRSAVPKHGPGRPSGDDWSARAKALKRDLNADDTPRRREPVLTLEELERMKRGHAAWSGDSSWSSTDCAAPSASDSDRRRWTPPDGEKASAARRTRRSLAARRSRPVTIQWRLKTMTFKSKTDQVRIITCLLRTRHRPGRRCVGRLSGTEGAPGPRAKLRALTAERFRTMPSGSMKRDSRRMSETTRRARSSCRRSSGRKGKSSRTSDGRKLNCAQPRANGFPKNTGHRNLFNEEGVPYKTVLLWSPALVRSRVNQVHGLAVSGR